MSWEEVGIIDPKIRWNGKYTDWNANTLEDMYENTLAELDFYRDDISEIKSNNDDNDILGEADDFGTWLDYVEQKILEACDCVNFREKLLEARFELVRLGRYFDDFVITNDIRFNYEE